MPPELCRCRNPARKRRGRTALRATAKGAGRNGVSVAPPLRYFVWHATTHPARPHSNRKNAQDKAAIVSLASTRAGADSFAGRQTMPPSAASSRLPVLSCSLTPARPAGRTTALRLLSRNRVPRSHWKAARHKFRHRATSSARGKG